MEKLDVFDVKVVNGMEMRWSVVKNVNLAIEGLERRCKDLENWDFDVQDEYLYQRSRKELFDKCLLFKGMLDGYYDMRILAHSVHRRLINELEELVDKFK